MQNTYQCKSKIYYPFTLNLNIYATVTLEISSKNSELAEILQAPPRKVLVEIDLYKALATTPSTTKGGVPTASSTHENSHEPDTGNTPPTKPGAPNGAAA